MPCVKEQLFPVHIHALALTIWRETAHRERTMSVLGQKVSGFEELRNYVRVMNKQVANTANLQSELSTS